MAHIDRRPGIRPRLTIGRRLDLVARAGFPACITLLLMLLIEAPLGISGQPALLPAIAVGCVWFWSLLESEFLPPPIVFLLGLLLDFLGYLPPGVGVLTLLCVHGSAVGLRRFLALRGFVWSWSVFTVVATGAALLIWLLVMILTMRLLSPAPAIFQSGLTIAIYPLLAVPLAAAQRAITHVERS